MKSKGGEKTDKQINGEQRQFISQGFGNWTPSSLNFFFARSDSVIQADLKIISPSHFSAENSLRCWPLPPE
jgi:hypothetical protein